jgi:hypothetical protein
LVILPPIPPPDSAYSSNGGIGSDRVASIKVTKTKILTLSLVVLLSSILVIIGTGLTAYSQQQETKVFATGEEFCKDNPSTKGCETPVEEPQPQPITPKPIEEPFIECEALGCPGSPPPENWTL